MIRTAILGASGYVGGELLRLVSAHPDLEAAKLFGTGGKPTSIEMYGDAAHADDVQSALAKQFPNVQVKTWKEINRPLFLALRLEKIVMFATISLIIFVAALNLISSLSMLILEKRPAVGVLRTLGATERTILTLFLEVGLPGVNLTFSKAAITVKAGESIRLTFTNPDVVPHNWVLIKPGALERVGGLANKMVSDPEAATLHYVPKSPDVLAYTDIVTATIPPQHRGVAGSLAMVTRTVGTVSAAALVMLLFARLEAGSGFLPA